MTDRNLAEKLTDGEAVASVRERQRESQTIPRADYTKLFRDEVTALAALTDGKNSSYANDDDALANFRLIEHLSHGRLTTADGILTRMTDKLQRIVNLHYGASNNFESEADNLMDLAVYAIILKIHKQRGGR
jgi:hypothetical protein